MCGCVAAIVAVAAAAPSAASERLADVDVRDVALQVNASGEALIAYTRADGTPRRVLVWGAIGARAPDRAVPQVRFRYDYSGGWRKYRARTLASFAGGCRSYDGPPLVHLVAACKAPDGSYWALQSWQRVQPLRGFAPFRPEHAVHELHVSHWRGPLPLLEVSPNWTYGGMWQGLFGRLTYEGRPVHGFVTPTERRSDRYGRFVYIDSLNSRYGPGWRRDAAKATHLGNGGFCYSFVPQRAPAGYPTAEVRPPGNGERHRVTVSGPGVTPIVQWEGPGLGAFDRRLDATFNRLFDTFLAGDRYCARER